MEFKEILLGVGFGNIKFGFTREQVKNILGEPDEINEIPFDDEEEDIHQMTESWDYYDYDISLNFDEEDDWRLTTIETGSEQFTINGKSIVGMEKDELIEFIKTNNLGEAYYEDFEEEGFQGQVITLDDNEIDFWMIGDKVSEVQWGPFFEDEDNIKWPE